MHQRVRPEILVSLRRCFPPAQKLGRSRRVLSPCVGGQHSFSGPPFHWEKPEKNLSSKLHSLFAHTLTIQRGLFWIISLNSSPMTLKEYFMSPNNIYPTGISDSLLFVVVFTFLLPLKELNFQKGRAVFDWMFACSLSKTSHFISQTYFKAKAKKLRENIVITLLWTMVLSHHKFSQRTSLWVWNISDEQKYTKNTQVQYKK